MNKRLLLRLNSSSRMMEDDSSQTNPWQWLLRAFHEDLSRTIYPRNHLLCPFVSLSPLSHVFMLFMFSLFSFVIFSFSCTLSRLLSSYLFLSLLPSFSLLFYFVCAHCHFISLLSRGSLSVSVWCQDAMSCLCVGVKSVHVSPYYKFWCLVLYAPRRIDHDVRNSCLSGSRSLMQKERRRKIPT